MKTVLLAVAAALLLIGCAAHPHVTRKASYDLRCPEDQLEVTEIDEKTQQVRGCGNSATYVQVCKPGGEECTWMANDGGLSIEGKTVR